MGKINVYDKIMSENQKEKIWKSKKFYIISLSKFVYKWNSQVAKAS